MLPYTSNHVKSMRALLVTIVPFLIGCIDRLPILLYEAL